LIGWGKRGKGEGGFSFTNILRKSANCWEEGTFFLLRKSKRRAFLSFARKRDISSFPPGGDKGGKEILRREHFLTT